MDVFVARQPIFDRNDKVVAYELLYRTDEKNFFDESVSSNIATSILLMNSFYSFGIDHLIGGETAYINFSKALVENDIPLLLDEKLVVIELLEGIKPDMFFINKVKYLKERGYSIALDDFTHNFPYDELIELADILKVDFLKNTSEQIIRICSKYKKLGKILLAEKVETYEEYIWAKKNGFDFFQGYFFSRPLLMKRKALNDSAYQYFRLLEKLNVPEPNYKEIAHIIEIDVTLTFNLLKVINSRFSFVNNVTSIQHGLSILGINSFKKWVSLAMMQNVATHKTSEIIKTALIRSSFMEKVALSSNLRSHSDEITFVGILSVIDVLLESPMEEIVKILPLHNDVKDTLMGKETRYSSVFNILKCYERGSFNDLNEYCQIIAFDINQLPKIYCNSIKWAEDLFEYMQ